jgi:hypothetical protein
MKNRRVTIWVVVAIVLVSMCRTAPVQAGLIGKEITAQWLYPSMSDIADERDFYVGTGVELPPEIWQGPYAVSIDVGDDYVFFTGPNYDIWWGYTAANGCRLIDKNGTIEDIVGFTIGTTTGNVTGLDPEDLVFTADSIFVNFGASGASGSKGESVHWGPGTTIRLDIVFIPEPGTLMLLGLSGLVVRTCEMRGRRA